MKKLSLILMLSISTVFVGCKKEISTVDTTTTTTTGGTSSASDWDSVYTFEENSYIKFSDNKKIAVFAAITPFGLKTTITTDGGLSWSSNTSKFSFENNVPQNMLFFDSKIGYAQYFTGIFKTEDGGLNWIEQKFKNYTYSLTTDKSLIVFTTDSIHVIENGSITSHFRDIQNLSEFFGGGYYSFYTDNAIYLHSKSNSNVLKSEDNGKTWQALTFGASFQNIIRVLNSTTWYTNSNYKLYVTKDKGITWNIVDNGLYNKFTITNGIIFTSRGVSLSDFKPMYSTDGINFKENKLIDKNAYEFFTLNGRVYYIYGQNLYRRKF